MPRSREDFPGTELLRTRRLRLRGFRATDLPDLLRLGSTPRVTALLLDLPLSTLAQACGFIEWVNDVYREQPGLGIWHAEAAPLGFVGFFSLMREAGTGEISLGTRLLPQAWGRGYALEAGAALCEHAFGALTLPRLIGQCDARNRAVPPLLARLGFVPETGSTPAPAGVLRFALQREDWQGIRRRVRA